MSWEWEWRITLDRAISVHLSFLFFASKHVGLSMTGSWKSHSIKFNCWKLKWFWKLLDRHHVCIYLRLKIAKGVTQRRISFFRLICTKSICICHCLHLSCRESPSVFISVSHFRFQFQPEDRVFFELSDIERLTSFKLRTANRAPPRFSNSSVN